MAADRPDGAADDGAGRDFAVVCSREEGQWQVDLLPERASADLDTFVAALRQQAGNGPMLGLVDIADDFFVAVRFQGDHARYLLSDVTAADEWQLARDVLERLGLPEPADDDFDDVEPVGDLALFADLGLSEMELGVLLSDVDAYADEMLFSIARRLGFGEDLERIVDTAAR
jgi:putative tRNA adenosine deaminase-associated protein